MKESTKDFVALHEGIRVLLELIDKLNAEEIIESYDELVRDHKRLEETIQDFEKYFID